MPHDSDLPFRVYCVRGGRGEREIVAGFARYIEAEVFIHCELLHSTSRGTDTGRFWGTDGDGRQTHFWIESSQVTASARQAM